METKEKNFENDIEARLLAQGYRKGSMATYDKVKAIDMPVLVEFIQATQPKMWQRYLNVYGEKAEKQLYTIFQQNVELRRYLDKMQYPYEYYENGGGHIWRNWRIYLSMFAQRLFWTTRIPHRAHDGAPFFFVNFFLYLLELT